MARIALALGVTVRVSGNTRVRVFGRTVSGRIKLGGTAGVVDSTGGLRLVIEFELVGDGELELSRDNNIELAPPRTVFDLGGAPPRDRVKSEDKSPHIKGEGADRV